MHPSLLRLSLVALIAAALPAQKAPPLSIDTIMRGPALTGYPPAEVRWSGDSSRVYFAWKQASDPVLQPLETYVAGRDGSGLRKLTEDEARLAPSSAGDLSRDRSQSVFTRDGDLYLLNLATGATRPLTRTGDIESNPHFTPDGKRVWFTRSGNLYALTLAVGLVEQLTDIRPAGATQPGPARGAAQPQPPAGEPQKGTDSQEFVKKEERELLDAVRQKAAAREAEEARLKRVNPRKPYTLQPRQSVTAIALSPGGRLAVATISERAERAKTTIVPNYVTESAYTEDIQSRSNVGDLQSRNRIGLFDVETGEAKFIDASDLAKPGTRELELQQPVWSEDGVKAVLLARAADNKDRWILALDPATAKTRVIAHDHDDAWIGGPGMYLLGWLADNQTIYFQSERTGYSHLYTAAFDGGEPRALTSGPWEVLSAKLSIDRSTFYLTTNEGDPAQVHLYTMPAAGGPREKITTRIGHHSVTLSPDERWIADVYSYTNRPPELYVMENRGGAEELKITSSPAGDFAAYPWRDVPLVKFKARDGVEIPARLYKSPDFRKGGPAVIFVHGAGYLQNVHRWWSQYSREYMFHHFLMDRGYLVLDLDYRGSAGYGRDWRTAIYRHMGGKDLDDQVDAARWLASQHGVDAKRIGIYGGSYGGFITLMAMFTEPGVFAAGAALRPVTDWSHYNNGYTSNILNTPQKDAEAYRKSSPIYFASGLKGALLICHGMVDTNVHFQDSVRLAQKLIELGKENWELAAYPVEDHGFVQPSSWADEYRRIFSLFEKNLK